jgi:protein associated with RNAse G/E
MTHTRPSLNAGDPVTVQYFKYPESLHWRHDLRWLGTDDLGIWLGGAAGTTVQRGHEPEMAWPRPFVQLIPSEGWFSVLGNGRTSRYEYYVDITTAPVWTAPDRVEMVDLDLDVVRDWDGNVAILDEEEFHEHQISLGYPDWLIDRARAVTAQVVLAVEAEAAPFDARSHAWLDRLADLG